MRWALFGSLSAAVFLLALFALQIPFWMAALIGGAVYLGLQLALGGDRDAADVLANPEEATAQEIREVLRAQRADVQEIRRMASAVGKRDVQRKLEDISLSIEGCIAYLEAHPQAIPAAGSSLGLYVGQTRSLVADYVGLRPAKPQGEEAESGVAAFEASLDSIKETFDKLYGKLISEDVIGIKAGLDAFKEMTRIERL